jgi:hypothetical protein
MASMEFLGHEPQAYGAFSLEERRPSLGVLHISYGSVCDLETQILLAWRLFSIKK